MLTDCKYFFLYIITSYSLNNLWKIIMYVYARTHKCVHTPTHSPTTFQSTLLYCVAHDCNSYSFQSNHFQLVKINEPRYLNIHNL